MIKTRASISLDTAMLSFILDQTLNDEHFSFPTFDGDSKEKHVFFQRVEEHEGVFQIFGELEYEDEMHPICFKGVISGSSKITSVQYEIETRLDGEGDDDDEDEDAGEEWKRFL